jgi:hypothetical protein
LSPNPSMNTRFTDFKELASCPSAARKREQSKRQQPDESRGPGTTYHESTMVAHRHAVRI